MNYSEISSWISMADVTVKRSKSKQVTERVKTGLCLHCDNRATRRGLCSMHYQQFRREMLAQPTRERAAWVLSKVRDGLVLNNREVDAINKTNIFRSEVV